MSQAIRGQGFLIGSKRYNTLRGIFVVSLMTLHAVVLKKLKM
jgi:hypothetical protein